MKIKSKDFTDSLLLASSIIGARTAVPIHAFVLIKAEKGKFHMESISYSERVVCEAECEGDDLLPACVCASHLTTLSALFGDELDIGYDGQSIHITTDGKVFSLHTQVTSEFSVEQTDTYKKISADCEELAKAIKSVSFCAHKDKDFRPAIHGVHVCNGFVEATNGKDFARHTTEKFKAEFLVSLEHVVRFCQFLQCEGAVLSISDKRVRVQHKTGEYTFQLPEHPFPSMEVIDKLTFKEKGKFEPSKWVPIFRTMVGLSKDRCDVSVCNGQIESVSKAAGTFSVPIPGESLPVDLQLNGEAFVRCLEAFEEGLATMSIGDETMVVSMEQGKLKTLSGQMRYKT